MVIRAARGTAGLHGGRVMALSLQSHRTTNGRDSMRPLPRHLPALDGLRGIAILLVILTHASGGWLAAASIELDTFSWPATFSLPGWLSRVSGQAIHGVTLFFVVSAFTLTLSLAKGGDLRAYAIRRIARVGPGYWLAGIVYPLIAARPCSAALGAEWCCSVRFSTSNRVRQCLAG